MSKRAVESTVKRVALNMKATPALRAQLEAAAAASGRSLTAEVEHRVMLSFEWERAHHSIELMLAKAALTADDFETPPMADPRAHEIAAQVARDDLKVMIKAAVGEALREALLDGVRAAPQPVEPPALRPVPSAVRRNVAEQE